MSFRSLIFCILFFVTSLTFAQKNNFNSYTIKNGLPQNTVYKIFQDSKGYIWFCTDGGGVSKFDGSKHQYFDKSKGLAGNVVRDVIEDHKGNLWFATDEGVSFFDGISFNNIGLDQGLNSEIIISIFQDAKQRVWVGTSGGGVSIIEKKDSLVVKNFTTGDGLASNSVFSILEDNFNRIWLAYIGGSPQMISYNSGEFKIQDINTSFNYDVSAVYCGMKDSQGNIWYGSIKHGVYKYQNISLKSNPTIINYNIINGLKDNYVLSLCEKDGSIWIGTNDGGIHYLENNKFNYLTAKDGLPNNQILNLCKDREDNIWISCMGEGVLKLNGFNFSHFSSKDGLSSNQVSGIKRNKHDSTFWISTYEKGIQKIKIEGNNIIHQKSILSEHPFYSNVRTFDIDVYNNVWVGTQNGMVVLKDEEIYATVSSEDELAGDQINTILCATTGMVWIGTSSGLSFYNGEMFGVFTEDEGLIHNEVQTIIESTDGTIWIGTLGGLASYYDNSMTTYNEEEGLSNLKIHSLVEADENNILIGTFGGGIYLLNRKKPKEIQHLLFDEQLTSNNIYGLQFKDEHTLIVATDKGFDKVQFNNDWSVKTIEKYTENNGFLAIENNLNTLFVDDITKNIIFGTVNGITIYQSELEKNENIFPSILIEDIKLFNQHVNWTEYASINNDGLPTNLTLPYNKNFVSFQFSTIHFTNPNNITYKYKLKGLSDDWYTTNSNEIVFQGLEPNTYSLIVKSITENGKESVPYEFSFIISPPFYKTWWFYTISIFFIIGIIFLYVRLRLSKLKKDKLVLEQTVKERTKEVVKQKHLIEEKNKEITDSITYSQRIQNAILPDDDRLNSYFDEYFVLFNPKDIVSGDFYWANEKNGKHYFVAADCTGHGVPGAIMSVIGHTSLETTLKDTVEYSAGEFLDALTNNLVHTLVQSSKQVIKDGMDLALCIYDKQKNVIEYAGANNPIYIIRPKISGFDEVLNEQSLSLENKDYYLFEIKATKQPIGHFEHRNNFITHTINMKKNDVIYLFSDGFADQFGGENGKKFKYKPFKQLLLELQLENMNKQKELLNKALNEWMRPDELIHHEQIDDVLIFSVKVS
ncbi:MAG: SpoIIE family protein phosphatase [Flavobacteriales bacterium]|nr:SpoIIE family protein phosphatase [Flavobacteriales bacterium]MBL1233948.1 SpoIIE family protein phosphatase [Flavobacteriales bacterium]